MENKKIRSASSSPYSSPSFSPNQNRSFNSRVNNVEKEMHNGYSETSNRKNNDFVNKGKQSVVPYKTSSKKKKRKKRIVIFIVLLVLVVIIAIPLGLILSLNSKIRHVDALSNMGQTSGQTWLIAGSDARDGAISNDGTTGERSDSIMILHKPTSGPSALISIPRDTLVDIPGNGQNKVNASYAFGGPKLLVKTIENLTKMKVDHFISVEMMSVKDMVDALGTINLCSDLKNIDDKYSGLKWNGGCHDVNGDTALAFSRMRYQDPIGDFGRQQRQAQVIKQVFKKTMEPSTILNFTKFNSIASAGLDSVKVDEKANLLDLLFLAFNFKDATGDSGITGTPPISSMGYPTEYGSVVLLDSNKTPKFFEDIKNGKLKPGKVGGIEQ